MFDHKIKPDYVIMRQAVNEKEIPLIVVEVKRTGKRRLKDDLEQHYR
jgi:hypothetical protein